MERFKAAEKEMKTKAFSKEGLNLQAKLDPKEQAKLDSQSWISVTVDKLAQQIESTEAEVETLNAGQKRKKGGNGERASELESLNERRRWHVGRLEIMLRLLENGQLPPEKADSIKDDVTFFEESNAVGAYRLNARSSQA